MRRHSAAALVAGVLLAGPATAQQQFVIVAPAKERTTRVETLRPPPVFRIAGWVCGRGLADRTLSTVLELNRLARRIAAATDVLKFHGAIQAVARGGRAMTDAELLRLGNIASQAAGFADENSLGREVTNGLPASIFQREDAAPAEYFGLAPVTLAETTVAPAPEELDLDGGRATYVLTDCQTGGDLGTFKNAEISAAGRAREALEGYYTMRAAFAAGKAP